MADFFPFQAPLFVQRGVAFAVRSPLAGTPGLATQIERAVWSVNPDLPIASVRTMQNFYDRSLARTSFTLVMLVAAAGAALVLGVVGLYGVLSYVVSTRRREIAIRFALGARRPSPDFLRTHGTTTKSGFATANAAARSGAGG